MYQSNAESPGLPDYSTDVAIDGYVQFGDSYAAGMGTGTTTSDKCRVGSNNYGKLLYRWFNNGNIPFESRVCSGDTLSGVNNQINAWSSSNVPNVGTISGKQFLRVPITFYSCLHKELYDPWGW